MYPEDLKYSKDHIWCRIEGNIATIGLTHYAQDQLGDIIYIEFPEVGKKVNAGERIGLVESTKTVTDLISPLTGEVKEVNGNLPSNPSIINSDPYGEGWILKIEIENQDEVNSLLSSSSYQELIS